MLVVVIDYYLHSCKYHQSVMGILSAVPGSQKVGMPHKQGQVPESLPSRSPFFASVFKISVHYNHVPSQSLKQASHGTMSDQLFSIAMVIYIIYDNVRHAELIIELVCRLVRTLLTLIHPSATDLWKRIPERIASSVNNSPSLVLFKTDLQRKINKKI